MSSALKRRAASIARSFGYTLSRRCSPAVALFHALCEHRDSPPGDPEIERFVAYCRQHHAISRAQRFQDLLADFVMEGRPGVFCEFGATDGLSLSNTAMLEQHRGWRGLLAEPSRQWHARLAANRPNAIIDTRCVYRSSGETLSFAEVAEGEYSGLQDHQAQGHEHRRAGATTYPVQTISLDDLLDAHGIEHLDYLSVDTEGSELVILQAFDFARFRPRLITVEHCFSDTRDPLFRLLTAEGYRRIFDELSAFDDWYVRRD